MKKKILIVDDDQEILALWKPLLSRRGFQIFLARNAEEFQRQAMSVKPDIIILDIMLGEESGPMAYDQLLAQGFDKNVPVLFLTNLVGEGSSSSALPGRTIVLHSKLIDVDDLLKEISSLLPGVEQGNKS